MTGVFNILYYTLMLWLIFAYIKHESQVLV